MSSLSVMLAVLGSDVPSAGCLKTRLYEEVWVVLCSFIL